MKTKTLVYGLAGVLTSSALAGLVIFNNAQAQVSNSEHNTHHPSKETTPSPQRGMIKEIDQHFIEVMIPHHAQAVEMADIALSRAQHPEIKKLATDIKKDQNREIQQMKAWYKAWYGKEVPTTLMTEQEMMAMDRDMCQQMNPNMMNCNMMGMKADLAALRNAPDFDKEFIRQMIPHHRMAVMMSQMAASKATKPEIRQLAQSIIQTQTAEINQMRQWYQAWYKSNPESS